jgi:hypothetical protein
MVITKKVITVTIIIIIIIIASDSTTTVPNTPKRSHRNLLHRIEPALFHSSQETFAIIPRKTTTAANLTMVTITTTTLSKIIIEPNSKHHATIAPITVAVA